MPKSIEEVIQDSSPRKIRGFKVCKITVGEIKIIAQSLRSAGCIMKHDIEWPGERKHGVICRILLFPNTWEDCTCGTDEANQMLDQCRKAVETTTSK